MSPSRRLALLVLAALLPVARPAAALAAEARRAAAVPSASTTSAPSASTAPALSPSTAPAARAGSAVPLPPPPGAARPPAVPLPPPPAGARAPGVPPPAAPGGGARAPAKKRARVAVIDVKALQGVKESSAAVVTEMIATEITNLRRYDVVSRADIQTMLGFQLQRKMLGCAEDASCMAEIGGALGADYLVSGQVSEFGNRYRLALSLQDVRKAKVISRVGLFCDRSEEALGPATQRGVTTLFRELESGGLPPPLLASGAAAAPAPSSPRLRTAGLVVGGVGLAGLAAAGAFDVLGARAYDREKSAAAAHDLAAYDAARAEARSRGNVAKALYVGGAVTAGTGLALYLVGARPRAVPVALDVVPLPGGALAVATGTLP